MKEKARKVFTLLYLVCSFLIAGCSSMASIPPEVSLVDLKFQDFTFLETTLQVNIRLDNENPEDIQLTGAKYRLFINGEYVGKGMSNERFTIPSFGSSEQLVVVRLGHLSILSNLQTMMQSDMFDYKLESDLYFGGIQPYHSVKHGRFDGSK